MSDVKKLVEEQAHDLLASAYCAFGLYDSAQGIAEDGPHGPEEEAAVRAIAAALSSRAEEVERLREALRMVLHEVGCEEGPCPHWVHWHLKAREALGGA